MAIAWYICGYNIRYDNSHVPPRPQRYCAVNDFGAQIIADGGDAQEIEVLGGYALVKVRATQTTLNAIAGTTGFQRIPLSILDTPLSSLTATQRTAIRNKILAMGYTPAEVVAALGTNAAQLGTHTLREALRFAAQRRLKARLDTINNQIVLDGEYVPCSRTVEAVDAAVQ
jgi:hypothetical protein